MNTETSAQQRIIEARKALGVSQWQFADELGVEQATVSRWETGKATPRGSVLKLLDTILAPKKGKRK